MPVVLVDDDSRVLIGSMRNAQALGVVKKLVVFQDAGSAEALSEYIGVQIKKQHLLRSGQRDEFSVGHWVDRLTFRVDYHSDPGICKVWVHKGRKWRSEKEFKFGIGDIVNLTNDEVGRTGLFATIIAGKQGPELVLFHFEDTGIPEGKPTSRGFERLGSVDDVLDRLDEDFDWVEEGDIINPDGHPSGHIVGIMAAMRRDLDQVEGDNYTRLARPDAHRLGKLYALGREGFMQRGAPN
ncbi:MAG: hypothetical protein PHS44_00370 [Candidatus Dojkabacteria bacterium]|nr:hypothetical protein [Candidatus Dojkabacteria bacterium]